MLNLVKLADYRRPEPAFGLSDRLIVALDVEDAAAARAVVDEMEGITSFFKIGLRLQFRDGLKLAEELVSKNMKVFLDSKVFDIDETVTGVVKQVVRMGVTYLTIHGDPSIVRAAVKARGNDALKLLSVTCLTSLDEADLKDQGFNLSMADYVRRRAISAIDAGCDGVIASGQEASLIRSLAQERNQDSFKVVTPGIRPQGDAAGDQKRVTTLTEAIKAGADHLVVGRPILAAQDRRAKAKAIMAEIAEALAMEPPAA